MTPLTDNATPENEAFMTGWPAFVADRRASTLAPLLAEDVVLLTPLYWKSREGRALASQLIAGVASVFGEVTYVRKWISGNDIALEFATKVDSLDVKGIDLFKLNSSGLVCEMEVMVRPPNALIEIRKRMEALAAGFTG